jgi:hypothetical protein
MKALLCSSQPVVRTGVALRGSPLPWDQSRYHVDTKDCMERASGLKRAVKEHLMGPWRPHCQQNQAGQIWNSNSGFVNQAGSSKRSIRSLQSYMSSSRCQRMMGGPPHPPAPPQARAVAEADTYDGARTSAVLCYGPSVARQGSVPGGGAKALLGSHSPIGEPTEQLLGASDTLQAFACLRFHSTPCLTVRVPRRPHSKPSPRSHPRWQGPGPLGWGDGGGCERWSGGGKGPFAHARRAGSRYGIAQKSLWLLLFANAVSSTL